jgi:zinc D-Ala-D-Ala carboxypeptidase
MKLSEHFSLDEFVFSSTALRKGIDNSPSLEIISHLTTLANGMEKVRLLLGEYPIHVDSGYRCFQLNKAVGGAMTSAHMDGYAADFISPDFGTPYQIVKAIKNSNIVFDKVIMEHSWAHISFAPTARKIILTANFDKTGHATYTAGV